MLREKPWVIAHRGASKEAPENTMIAFEIALRQGADGIETDIYMTADGSIVCIHDASTKRTSGIALDIVHTLYDDLAQLDVGSWKHKRYAGQSIPRLDQVLEVLPGERMLYLEIKDAPRIVKPLHQQLLKSGMNTQQLRLMSFQPSVLLECSIVMPDIQTLWLVDWNMSARFWKARPGRLARQLRSMGASGINCRAIPSIVTSRWVRAMQGHGFSVHVWTVNRLHRARYYKYCGVESITTDVPDLIRSVVDADFIHKTQTRSQSCHNLSSVFFF